MRMSDLSASERNGPREERPASRVTGPPAVPPMLQDEKQQQEAPEAQLRAPPGGKVDCIVRDERGPECEHDEARHGTPSRSSIPAPKADTKTEQDQQSRKPGRDELDRAAGPEESIDQAADGLSIRKRVTNQELAKRHVPDRVRREYPMQGKLSDMRRYEQQREIRSDAGCEAEEGKEGHSFGVVWRDERVLQTAEPNGPEHDDDRNADPNDIQHQTDHAKLLQIEPRPDASITTEHRCARRVPVIGWWNRVAGSIVGLLFACVLGYAVLLPAGRATESGVIEFVRFDGSCSQRLIQPAQLGRLEVALAEEALRLRSMAERIMADAAGGRLAEAREKVPEFGAWAYDWVQSYITSYRVIARLASGLVASVQSGEGTDALSARIMEEISMPIREEFRARVLSNNLSDALRDDLVHAGAALDRAWRAALARAETEIAALPAVSDGVVLARMDFSTAVRSLERDLVSLAPRDALAVVSEQTSDTAAVFMRTMRPMAARFGAVVVRASEAGSIVATAGAFGYVLGGAPGVVVGAASGVGVSWAIDWGLNRFDAALNRSAFEGQALAVIEAAERRIAEHAGGAVARALDQRLSSLRAPPEGCSGAGGPR